MTIDFARLREPFHAAEIEWRIGQAGIKQDKSVWAKAFAYVTNRAIQQRLDDVCGPQNWRNEFRDTPNDPDHKSVLCGLSIRIEGEWVTKWDGADNSDMEATKGGLSDSMKRAAVQWGIGRYLYDLEEGWADVLDKKEKDCRYQPANDKRQMPAFYWKPPQLPGWALPNGDKKKPDPQPDVIGELKGAGKVTTGNKIDPPLPLNEVQKQVIDSWANWLLQITPPSFDESMKHAKVALKEGKLKPPMIEPMLRRAGELATTAQQYDVLDGLVFAFMKEVKGKDDVFGKIGADIQAMAVQKLGGAA